MNPKLKTGLLHSGLFLLTFATTTMAGAEWVHGKSILVPGYTWADFQSGLLYSVPFLLILTLHEFGHYFTAVYYKVKTSLPYYIPLPPLPLMLGTLGAVIRIRSHIYSRKQNFDIGIAGPMAGFIVAMVILFYGFTHLPPPEYVYQFHPEYQEYGLNYAEQVYSPDHAKPNTIDVVIGKNLLFLFFEKFVADPTRVPNPHEMMHYPLLLAGFLSLIFTCLNLLPIGQLDGGHVLYGLLGFRKHRIVASIIFCLFLFYAGLGVLRPGEHIELVGWLFDKVNARSSAMVGHYLSIAVMVYFYYLCLGGLRFGLKDTWLLAIGIFALQYLLAFLVPGLVGYYGWFLFAFVIGRLIGVPHPPAEIEEPLSRTRKVLGWLALVIFILCFTPKPIEVTITEPPVPAAGVNA